MVLKQQKQLTQMPTHWGEDVNVGWHQYVKEKKPSQIMDVDIYFDPVNGTYKTLDAMASDIINTLIDQCSVTTRA